MKPRIAAITGKLEDTVISMTEGPVLIGRQAGATLKIGNASVSRRHAVIERDGDRFVIADLGSRNGTFVNDVPVRFAVNGITAGQTTTLLGPYVVAYRWIGCMARFIYATAVCMSCRLTDEGGLFGS